jgi:hypothetical protein
MPYGGDDLVPPPSGSKDLFVGGAPMYCVRLKSLWHLDVSMWLPSVVNG